MKTVKEIEREWKEKNQGCVKSDGTGYKNLETRKSWIWENNKPKKCESCEKETDELYCTPIGRYNWRCRECQIALREAIPGCAEMEEDGMPYTSIPIKPSGYEDPPKRKLERNLGGGYGEEEKRFIASSVSFLVV